MVLVILLQLKLWNEREKQGLRSGIENFSFEIIFFNLTTEFQASPTMIKMEDQKFVKFHCFLTVL
jgi:hypothetical protein